MVGVVRHAERFGHQAELGTYCLHHSQAVSAVLRPGDGVADGNGYAQVGIHQVLIPLETTRCKQNAFVRLDAYFLFALVGGHDAYHFGYRIRGFARGYQPLSTCLRKNFNTQAFACLRKRGVHALSPGGRDVRAVIIAHDLAAAAYDVCPFPVGLILPVARQRLDVDSVRGQDVDNFLRVGKIRLDELFVVHAHLHVVEVLLGEFVAVAVLLREGSVRQPGVAARIRHGAAHHIARLDQDDAHSGGCTGDGCRLPRAAAHYNEVGLLVPCAVILRACLAARATGQCPQPQRASERRRSYEEAPSRQFHVHLPFLWLFVLPFGRKQV